MCAVVGVRHRCASDLDIKAAPSWVRVFIECKVSNECVGRSQSACLYLANGLKCCNSSVLNLDVYLLSSIHLGSGIVIAPNGIGRLFVVVLNQNLGTVQ